MPRTDRPAPRAGDGPLAIGVFVALFASVMPLFRVVEPGSWVMGVVILAALILGAGHLARRYRLPAVAVSSIEAVVWVVVIGFVFLRDSSLFGFIPTPESIGAVPPMLQQAGEEIALGVAPLSAGRPLSLLIIGAVGLMAIILDHVVITARLPLVAAVGLIAVSLIPSIAVPDDIDILAFALLAGTILFLVRVETRTRQQRVETATMSAARAPASALVRSAPLPSTSAMALGIGAIAVVVALVVTPLLPPPDARAGGFGVSGVAINPTLRLGDDLRRPSTLEVLSVRTTASSAPYLRAVTLSSFNGRIWEPDRRDVLPLGDDAVFGPVGSDPDITVAEYTTEIEVRSLQTQWLPVPFPAVGVAGLPDAWSVMPYNRTVIGSTTTNSGQTYEVRTELPRPTLEQIRARTATDIDVNGFDRSTSSVPSALPTEVTELAEEVTADATTDYDRLVALQAWFRGPEFQYSLEAPVDGEFDGSGLRAVAEFLDVKEGYCVHFASAFALMARTLGMSSRIVVGYLPGTVPAGVPSEVQASYTVSSSQLHAWPEVYFQGIGWVQFDPTKSLGTPTSFSPASSGTADAADNAGTELDPGALGSASPTAAPGLDDPGIEEAGGGSVTTNANPLPWAFGVVGVLLALLIPALIRELRRRRQLLAARGGDAASAWISVQDVALDVGVSVPASETPRSFGSRLVAKHGVPADRMAVLIDGIERASYAPGGLDRAAARQMADAASAVRSALLASLDPAPRIAALLLPRSLVVRPGSMYAGPAVSAAP